MVLYGLRTDGQLLRELPVRPRCPVRGDLADIRGQCPACPKYPVAKGGPFTWLFKSIRRRPQHMWQNLPAWFCPSFVMFFAEPARAFANLRTALKPSGRLAFACWRKFDENPWLQVPLRAALEHVPPLPRPGPEDPGPFSFASEQRVHRILADAGFQSVMLEPRDFDLDIACGGGIEEALEAAMALGPTSRALQDQGPETRAAVATSIRRALQPYQRGKQVALAGAIWLVTANNA
jgi:hypothetical protein